MCSPFRRLLTLGLVLVSVSALADPMRPDTRPEPAPQPRATRPAEPSFRLTSIYILDDQRYAVINGRWLTVNDDIQQYRVTDILPDRVRLVRGARRQELTLERGGSLSITPSDEE